MGKNGPYQDKCQLILSISRILISALGQGDVRFSNLDVLSSQETWAYFLYRWLTPQQPHLIVKFDVRRGANFVRAFCVRWQNLFLDVLLLDFLRTLAVSASSVIVRASIEMPVLNDGYLVELLRHFIFRREIYVLLRNILVFLLEIQYGPLE